MAGIAYVYKRLWNPEVFIDTNGVITDKCRKAINGENKPFYHIKWHGGTQAGEELGTAASSVKDGTTTPFQITVVSDQANDSRSVAAGFVHSVALIGVSTESTTAYTEWLANGTTTTLGQAGRPKSTVEVVTMNGTTDVLSTRYYLWVDHAYACEWGTGATHDAEGNITIESPANTTLLTITATYNESNGGVWHFPPGAQVKTEFVRFMPTAALAAGDGVALTATYSGFDKELNDSNITDCTDAYTYIHYGGSEGIVHKGSIVPRYATKASKVLWSEALIANTQSINIEIIQSTQKIG